MAPDREGGACGSAVILLSSSSTRPRYTIMADGPRCQRRKQTKPRRNNGECQCGQAKFKGVFRFKLLLMFVYFLSIVTYSGYFICVELFKCPDGYKVTRYLFHLRQEASPHTGLCLVTKHGNLVTGEKIAFIIFNLFSVTKSVLQK